MSLPQNIAESIQKLTRFQQHLLQQFVAREEAIRLLILAAIAREHVLLIGPPGTAKTQVISRFAQFLQARRFHYLLTRFTEPAELFGPIDVSQFRKGVYRINTAGMLPHAEIAFLDEVFQANSAILNSLLTLLNERLFHNGSRSEAVPLISLVGASNSMPDDNVLQAFADRFMLRLQLAPVDEERVPELLRTGWEAERDLIEGVRSAAPVGIAGGGGEEFLITTADLANLHASLANIDLEPILNDYSQLLGELKAENIGMSDRRAVKGLKLIAAATLLRQSDKASPRDFWPLLYCWNRIDESETLVGLLRPRIEEAGGAMPDAVRPLEDIAHEFELLESQASTLATEAAYVVHLRRLNTLKKILRFYYPNSADLRRRVSDLIDSLIDDMSNIGNT